MAHWPAECLCNWLSGW